MRAFSHLEPPLRLYHGDTALAALPKELERASIRRAAVFCGRSLTREPAMQRVRDALGARCIGVFSGVEAHSPLPSVELAAQTLKHWNADAIVAVGGGSAIVTARAAAILLAEGQPAQALCTHRDGDGRFVSPKLTAPKIAQFVVPTTPTTAIVKAGSAVFDTGTDARLALFDPKTRALSVFIDPGLILSAPVPLATSASLNTFAMAVEGLESAGGDALSDGMLMHALRLLCEHMPRLQHHPADAELRGQLILAAVLCGRGTDFTGGGIASVLGHALGARCHIDNGLANAIVLPHTMRFNAPATAGRLMRIAQALDPGASRRHDPADPPGGHSEAIARVESLLAQLPIPSRLRDADVARDRLDDVARAAMGDWFLDRNPRAVGGPEELMQLLQGAW